MHENADQHRVAIVSVSTIFQDRAGNAEYLATLCKALKGLSCRIELFVLHPESGANILTHLQPRYLSRLDDIHMRYHIKWGTSFITLSPLYWARIVARAVLRKQQSNLDEDRQWGFAQPTRRALTWAGRRLDRFKPDLVIANYFNASAVFIHAPAAAKKAILVHDVLALRKRSFESASRLADFDPALIEAETRAFTVADFCLAITPEESMHIAQTNPGIQVITLPYTTSIVNGVSMPSSVPTCLFVGSDNTPNRDGLRWLLSEVWPDVLMTLPEAQLRIVGNVRLSPMERLPDNVTLVGTVDDLQPEYDGAQVVLVPLRVGSGLKIKLIEALGHGVPIVATSCGAAGVVEAPAPHLHVKDSAADFARAIVEVIHHSDHRNLRESALGHARRHYSEALTVEQLRSIMNAVIRKCEPTTPVTPSTHQMQ